MKKFIITENQLKTIVDKLITEANPGVEEKEINISNSFTSGEYNLTSTKAIDDAITEITKMFPSGSKIDVTIEASESRVPNKINGQYVPVGTLSKMRGDIIKKYLDGKKLPNFNFKIRDMGVQGPEFIKQDLKNPKKPFDNPRDKKYIPYQYVKLKIYASKETLNDESCLVDLEIYVDYDRAKYLSQFPGATPHQCDLAQFTLYANGIPIKNQTNNTYFIDLNNGNDGGNRTNKLVITNEDAKKILANKNEILISVYCAVDDGDGCHSDPLLITVKNNKNEVLLQPTFITLGKRLNHRQGRNIMTLDNCGKVINATVANASDLNDTDSVLPKPDRVDYKSPKFELEFKKQSRRDERENGDQFTIESLSQIYQYVDNNGKGNVNFPKNILLTTMSFFRNFNGKSWNHFKNYKNVSDEQQVELDNYMIKNNIKFVNNPNLYAQTNLR
jgi:hypothetical protein